MAAEAEAVGDNNSNGAALLRFRDECAEAIIDMLSASRVRMVEVEEAVAAAEATHRLLPDLVSAERFVENIAACRPHVQAATADEALHAAECRVAVLQAAAEQEAHPASGVDTDSAVHTTATGTSDDDSDDSDAPAPEELSMHLNPHLPITEAEYTAWLRMLGHLRRNSMLVESDAPRRLLMLMASVFTPAVAVDASDALGVLHRAHGSSWLDASLLKPVRRVVHRALRLSGAVTADGGSARKQRLRLRRKVFKARKRIWDTEKRRRAGLEEMYGSIFDSLRQEMSSIQQVLDPDWFKALITEHYASLEEQLARSLLEQEYTDLLSRMASSAARAVSGSSAGSG